MLIIKLATRPGFVRVQCWYQMVSLLYYACYMHINLLKIRIKIRWIVLKWQTAGSNFVLYYVNINIIMIMKDCSFDYLDQLRKRQGSLLLPTLIPLSEVGRTCFLSYHFCIIRQLFLRPARRRPAWRQPSLKLEWVLTTANATWSNSLTCLPKDGGARDN
jgi:hypothetical protein